ncbi:uncharacterized protein LOC110440783, partial [Mizuhopecten yessoensis]|uniref:uncharacterized protein LOC110440783 n=1 Tax=Mizuhopecten yessoensis TaxID=6573 RepID=UPI000B45E45E
VSKVFADPDPNFHIYLAFGQSNMEGQGPIEEQDLVPEPRFKMLNTFDGCTGHEFTRKLGEWYDALPPIANCHGHLGPADYFGRTLVKKLPEEVKVGVAVVAVAGCDIKLFEKDNYKDYPLADYMEDRVRGYGGNPYGRLIEMGKKAQEVGVIKGILFHQGETNNGQESWLGRVKAVYENILEDLDLKAEDTPFIAGEVVREEYNGLCSAHNAIIKRLPEVIPTAHVVSAKDLPPQDDNLHFSTESYRKFGARYADVMYELLTKNEETGKEDEEECWATPLGYPCCQDVAAVLETDEDGEWGAENGEWCGIVKNDSSCWAHAIGYKCCSTDKCKKVYEEDES